MLLVEDILLYNCPMMVLAALQATRMRRQDLMTRMTSPTSLTMRCSPSSAAASLHSTSSDAGSPSWRCTHQLLVSQISKSLRMDVHVVVLYEVHIARLPLHDSTPGEHLLVMATNKLLEKVEIWK